MSSDPSEAEAQKEIDRRTGADGLVVKYEDDEWHAFRSIGVKDSDADVVPARIGRNTVARARTFNELLQVLGFRRG